MNPFALLTASFLQTGAAATAMMADAQQVVAMRLWGMAGLWAVEPSETGRMVAEKLPALTMAAQAAFGTALAGGAPDRIAAAWLEPVAQQTSANRERLSRQGPVRF